MAGKTMTLYFMGSKHKLGEDNNTIGVLHTNSKGRLGWSYNHRCKGWDGPGAVFQESYMKKVTNQAIRFVLDNQPIETINLCGHSRGGYLSCRCAAYIAQRKLGKNKTELAALQNVNVINVDPVNKSGLDHIYLPCKGIIKKYHQILMMHEGDNTTLYKLHLTDSTSGDKGPIYTIQLPGSHGGGMACKTTPGGKVCFQTLKKFLSQCGTQFKDGPALYDYKQWCELYAGIVEIMRKGGKYYRQLNHGGKNYATDSVNTKTKLLSRSKKRTSQIALERARDKLHSNRWEKLKTTGDNLVDPVLVPYGKPVDETLLGDYFINMQHLRYFSKAYPAMFKRLRFGGNRTQAENEITDINLKEGSMKRTVPALKKLLSL